MPNLEEVGVPLSHPLTGWDEPHHPELCDPWQKSSQKRRWSSRVNTSNPGSRSHPPTHEDEHPNTPGSGRQDGGIGPRDGRTRWG